ncbi:hypothetical protein [Salinimicrobium sediminilitoris]|uniref:hypothetical protein n=1 Tax=Salinimicrobium sediminilitoris TaxID=2876715 RepID=UPI001E3824AA|nr:hypothetical protein [Salinimicrobium sediminilitoris]MCC8361019.1 hypothetical protein [Salinimicrobium sediminilitoris]
MNRSKYLPYPVFGKTGYKSSTYNGIISSIKLSKDEYIIKVFHSVSNKEIESRINSGELCCVTTVENTSFLKLTEVHPKCNEPFLIKIPRSLVRGRFELDVNFKICAAKTIHSFYNSDFTDVYSQYSFRFEKGNIVGETKEVSIKLDAGFHDLSSSDSFLKFSKRPSDQAQEITFRILPDQVIFYLPEEIFLEYSEARKRTSDLLLGNLVTPVLLELLAHIRKFESDYNDPGKYSWVQTLEEAIGDDELFDPNEDLLPMVDKILHSPILKSLMTTNSLMKQLDEYE